MSIMIEVKSKPVFLNKDLNIFIMFFHIIYDLSLVLMNAFKDKLDYKGYVVGWIVIDNVEVLFEVVIYLIIQEFIEFDSILFGGLKLLIIVQVLISNCIERCLPNIINALLTLVKTNI